MNQQYVLFGAGKTSLAAIHYFHKEQIAAVIDNCPDKTGTFFEGVPVISFPEYLKEYRGLQVIISIYRKMYFDVKEQLEHSGIYDYFTAPPVLYGFPTPEELADNPVLKDAVRIVFYGINPISIRMYEWLKEKGINNKCVFVKTMKEKNHAAYETAYHCIELEELTDDDLLIITTNEAEEAVREKLKPFFFGTVYDIYENAVPFHPELEVYKDKHKGQRCFIIGNGPSLQASDLEKLSQFGEKCFGANGIYRMYQQTAWRPDYYTLIDVMGLKIFYDYIREFGDDTFFIADYFYAELNHVEGINRFSEINKIYDGPPDFSNDITKGIAGGKTVTYAMIQIACYMGFSKIYLLGVDFSWSENGRSPHFYEVCAGRKHETFRKAAAVIYREETLEAYKAAKDYAEQHGVHIYNATRGGCLEVFERVDFDDLF